MAQRIETFARQLTESERIEFRKIIAWVRADTVCATESLFEERMRSRALAAELRGKVPLSELAVATPEKHA